MAGTIPMSLTQQLDEFGAPLAGGHLYLIQAGTVNTPQNGFQDSALTLALPNPIILDAAGRLPQFFLADGAIKIRLTDVNGVEKLVADGIIVTGASSGGGGGSPVDATTILATGDIKVRYGVGTISGFVRANGRTLGSATSGATERANSDAQALFEYLWNDANLAVSGGRGGSANADWTANKTIALPDWRGRAIAGLDDMGNTAAGRLTASFFGTSAIVLGAAGGSESHTLTTAQLAVHSHPSSINNPAHSHTLQSGQAAAASGGSFTTTRLDLNDGTVITNPATTAISINNASAGSGSAHNNVSPRMLTTIYLKL